MLSDTTPRWTGTEESQSLHTLRVLVSETDTEINVEVIGEIDRDNAANLWRRLHSAIALASQPRLLLLDEPTAGLTRSESDEVGAVIRDINQQGITVVLVDHNVRLVSAVCDVVAVLDWGRVIAQDTPSAVWQDPRVRSAYLGAGRHDQAGEG